jgi:hypothetical protein
LPEVRHALTLASFVQETGRKTDTDVGREVSSRSFLYPASPLPRIEGRYPRNFAQDGGQLRSLGEDKKRRSPWRRLGQSHRAEETTISEAAAYIHDFRMESYLKGSERF